MKELIFTSFIKDVDPDHHQKRREFCPVRVDKESIEAFFGLTPIGLNLEHLLQNK
jgi:hypothetical protein